VGPTTAGRMDSYVESVPVARRQHDHAWQREPAVSR
jgi:hypothetical protein